MPFLRSRAALLAAAAVAAAVVVALLGSHHQVHAQPGPDPFGGLEHGTRSRRSAGRDARASPSPSAPDAGEAARARIRARQLFSRHGRSPDEAELRATEWLLGAGEDEDLLAVAAFGDPQTVNPPAARSAVLDLRVRWRHLVESVRREPPGPDREPPAGDPQEATSSAAEAGPAPAVPARAARVPVGTPVLGLAAGPLAGPARPSPAAPAPGSHPRRGDPARTGAGTRHAVGRWLSGLPGRLARAARDLADAASAWFARQPEDVRAHVHAAAEDLARLADRIGDRWGGDAPPHLDPAVVLARVDGQSVLMAGRLPFPCFETQAARQRLDLDGPWRRREFAMDPSLSLARRDAATLAKLARECEGATSPDADDSSWESVDLPAVHDRLSGSPDRPCEPGPDGFVYRRRIDVPPSWAGLKVRLMALGANYVTDLWVNGAHAGTHEGGFASFALEVGPLLRPGPNLLVMRVHNIPWPNRGLTVPFADCDWFNYGGPYRSLHLEASPAFSIDSASLSWDGRRARVRVVASNAGVARASGTLSLALVPAHVSGANLGARDPEELARGAGEAARQDGPRVDAGPGQVRAVEIAWPVPAPRTWSPAQPDLYVLRVRLLSPGGQVVDRLSTQVGLRTVAVDRRTGRLLLNGVPAPFLAGVARHEESVERGRAVTADEIVRDLKLIRDELGANLLRTAHYPNDPLTYLVTDRLGLAAWEEIPVYWFPGPGAFRAAWERGTLPAMWREMVFRDFNRPSILFWGTANECGAAEARSVYIRAVNRERRAHYPDGRLIAQSAAAELPGPFDESQKECDVAGWTLYFGIGFYGEDRHRKDLDRTHSGTARFLDRARSHHPGKPLLATEFGYWANPDDSVAADQVRFFDEAMRAFRERPAVAGAVWWTAFDYYTVRTGTSTFGAFKLDRKARRPLADAIERAYRALTR
jgi:beta-glucuronidase